MGRTCLLCHAPIVGVVHLITMYPAAEGQAVHPQCADAWLAGDREVLRRLRLAACEAGHHRYPGQWTKDPADPYGDAAYWECAKGCGHIQRHLGYGIGRQIAELLGDDASQDDTDDEEWLMLPLPLGDAS